MTAEPAPTPRVAGDEPVIVVSSDTHVGPRLRDDLRPYCPSGLLGEFDDFVRTIDEQRARVYRHMEGRRDVGLTRNRRTEGHHDPHARLRDLDFDGVAAEVIFHGSQNEEPVPWGNFVVFLPPVTDDPRLVAAGRTIYNRWLADHCSVEPHRRAGLAQLPMWDVDAAVAELRWAHEHRLRGVNFPAPGAGLRPYNDPSWEPFWSVVEELQMPLTTHAGAGDPGQWSGREAMALVTIESGGWASRRAMHQMIFGGVFDRHPGVRLVLTEQPGNWWAYTLRELDSVWMAHRATLGDQVPEPPSTYCHRNVALGASFLAPFEAHDAVANGYVANVMWGSDYPHMEGTFQAPETPHDPSIGRVALRNTFAGLPADAVRAMAGLNAVRIYGLDETALAEVARRIDAPTPTELAEPVDQVPAGASPFAFRTFGPWA